jgi:hypothetical protein
VLRLRCSIRTCRRSTGSRDVSAAHCIHSSVAWLHPVALSVTASSPQRTDGSCAGEHHRRQ